MSIDSAAEKLQGAPLAQRQLNGGDDIRVDSAVLVRCADLRQTLSCLPQGKSDSLTRYTEPEVAVNVDEVKNDAPYA